MENPLDNPIWHALTGPHAGLAIGRGDARRYPAEVSPFAGIAEPSLAAYADLEADLPSGAGVVLFRPAEEPLPAGWETIEAFLLHQMVLPSDTQLPAPLPAEATVVRLGSKDGGDMMALVEAAKPRPFRPRTVELGGYIGIRDCDGRLVGMAGERLRVPGYREVSAICVHPDAQGQGFGVALTLAVVRAVIARGEVPFLHVWPDNPARTLYTRLGFRQRTELWMLWRRPVAEA